MKIYLKADGKLAMFRSFSATEGAPTYPRPVATTRERRRLVSDQLQMIVLLLKK